ncbi:DNA-processing protein DprA [Haloimpatiens sp. FM7330]|uniref:DNA-processing protein DprA n=1 Tax=Haloimpatiens sp. FM7330 TaxID=3298610 RepID=UPI00362839AA
MEIYDIWLALVRLSNRIKLQIVKKFKTTEEMWYYSIHDKCSFTIDIRDRLKKAWNISKIEEIMKDLKRKDIKIINFFDKNYPQKLKNYDDAPCVLFYKGNIKKLNDNVCVSVVGARNCSSYGIQCTKYIVKELCKNNINIISGMANGIDSISHETCIKNNGYTCAILGCGVDVIYPKKNFRLYNEMVQNGCVVSEFLPGTKPYPYNFPMRNRIISGLCDILIVIEAGEKSGSLITASLALEQGKDIMAVPGSVFAFQSKGTNKLIKDGAYPLIDVNDLFDLLGLKYERINFKNIFAKEKNNSKSALCKRIYGLIGDSPIHIDDIIRSTNIDIKRLYELLFEMQFNDEIMCLSGNYYVRTHNI